MTRKVSATSASEIHIFSPFRMYRSPRFSAVRLDASRIAAGGGLGQTVAADERPVRLRDEVRCFCASLPHGEQRQAVEADMNGQITRSEVSTYSSSSHASPRLM